MEEGGQTRGERTGSTVQQGRADNQANFLTRTGVKKGKRPEKRRGICCTIGTEGGQGPNLTRRPPRIREKLRRKYKEEEGEPKGLQKLKREDRRRTSKGTLYAPDHYPSKK